MTKRKTLTISLGLQMLEFIKREAHERQFPNVSEFMRYLVRVYFEEKQLKQQLLQNKKAIPDDSANILGARWPLKKDAIIFKEKEHV